MNFNIGGFVDISGEVISKNIVGILDIEDQLESRLVLNKDDKSFNIPESSDIFFELKEFNLLKDSESLSNMKLQFTNGGTIREETMSNKDGKYYPIIDNGIYTVNINGGGISLKLNKEILTNIPLSFFFKVNGLIEKRIGSTIFIHNSDYRMIVGRLYNQNNRHNCYEITISKDDKLYTRFFTNLDGKYEFALKNGIYDIRIKSDKYFKLIKNASFEENIDFSDLIRGEKNEY